ncbi:hypothetical protein JQ615_38855 [Bradyrhizobium jicamae]|uniref:Uncharacterized protein n=1 Tax=Bradyrhizobium jicamae TaxID=280332 RepID=A0ABS5FXP0_9BRAD|nr:hypothetical protein [Bradyrhizobium jicamae]MBR0801324.1 hypothetical protein [Bradyrhizobium jicamae]
MKKLLMAGLAVALATPTYAAQIWVNPAEGHGHVIHIKGTIEKGDANRFANAVGKAGVRPGDATVWLDSPGGLVIEGLPIARAVHKYGWNTYVGENIYCTSMCADIWLAGHSRFINSEAKLGFHSTGDKRGTVWVRNDVGNAAIFGFYRELGLSAKAARVLLAAEPGEDVIWLDSDLAKSLDIAAVTISADEEKSKEQPKVAALGDMPMATEKFTEAPKAAERPAEAPQVDKDNAGPPPVTAEDILPPKEETPREVARPRRAEPHNVERPYRRRYAGGYGGRVCGFSVPVPYIGGITIRGRC